MTIEYYKGVISKYGPACIMIILRCLEHREKYEECDKIMQALSYYKQHGLNVEIDTSSASIAKIAHDWFADLVGREVESGTDEADCLFRQLEGYCDKVWEEINTETKC